MAKDDVTWLNIAYVLFGALMAYLSFKAIHTASIELGWEERYDAWLPSVRMVSALVIGVGAAWWLRSNPERNDYFLAVVGETRKVVFPTFKDTRSMTIVVVVVCVIFGIILAGFDWVWGNTLKVILNAFGHII